jgi:hypothetical protein
MSNAANVKVPKKVGMVVMPKIVYVGKDGITFKQAVQLADLGYRILVR